MNAERWERLHLLCGEALARPEAARRAFLESACDDAVLRAEVAALLAVHERGGAIDELPTAWLGALAGPEWAPFAPDDRVAGRYVIRSSIGRGGMGEVYEAWDEELSIAVALKALYIADDGDTSLRRLKHEGLLARSVWHPNVCRVYDLGRHVDDAATTWFLTMELLRGVTLADRLRESPRLPVDRVRSLAAQMGAGMSAAHVTGVVHRDFKPANVMLVERDGCEQAVITDFGIAQGGARSDGADAPRDASIVGTPAYMAPEQRRGEEVGPAADIYAFGLVLFEMLTGRRPFADGSQDTNKPPSPRRFVPDLDERWDTVVLRCLEADPRSRFARAEEITDALEGHASAARTETTESIPRERHTLPIERDAFVGRAEDIARLRLVLDGAPRVVTLVGSGGMGKTRLAMRYAWQSLDAWPGGVWFCDLTDARSVEDVVSSLAATLGVPPGRGELVDRIGSAIAARGRCLVILDNVERALEHAAATVGRWSKDALDARFIVTSRERLGLDHETCLAVEPLSPDEGLELFAIRARQLRPGHAFDEAESAAAREIVRQVDGMPLAIELAASRIRVMSAADIVERMRKRFQLLTGGRETRHETLERTVDDSWDLLTPWQRTAWSQCSVFEGGFTLAAAEAVLDLGAWPEAPWIVDVVQTLLDKSLLRMWTPRHAPGESLPEARFGMYASLQEYARMRLPPGAARQHAEERHGAWYGRLGEYRGPETPDASGGWRREVAQRELENLVAACRRAIARGDGAIAVATLCAIWEVVELRGPFALATELAHDALAMTLVPDMHRRVRMVAARATWRSGRMSEARTHFETALATHRELGDRRSEGMVLGNLANLHAQQGRMDGAREHYEAALRIHREVGDRRSEGIVIGNLGILHRHQGRMAEAREHYEAALAIHREVGNRRDEGIVLGNLGILHRKQGRAPEARAHYDAALTIHREVANRLYEGIVLTNLGILHLQHDEREAADSDFVAALAIARELGDPSIEGEVLVNIGDLRLLQGAPDEARAHYETAIAIDRRVGNRRHEGAALGRLGSLLLGEGRMDEARHCLARGEALLREVVDRVELGKLLCARAVLEMRGGAPTVARDALREAEELVAQSEAGDDSELETAIVNARRAVAGEPVAP